MISCVQREWKSNHVLTAENQFLVDHKHLFVTKAIKLQDHSSNIYVAKALYLYQRQLNYKILQTYNAHILI